jgi:hypothetical protein
MNITYNPRDGINPWPYTLWDDNDHVIEIYRTLGRAERVLKRKQRKQARNGTFDFYLPGRRDFTRDREEMQNLVSKTRPRISGLKDTYEDYRKQWIENGDWYALFMMTQKVTL